MIKSIILKSSNASLSIKKLLLTFWLELVIFIIMLTFSIQINSYFLVSIFCIIVLISLVLKYLYTRIQVYCNKKNLTRIDKLSNRFISDKIIDFSKKENFDIGETLLKSSFSAGLFELTTLLTNIEKIETDFVNNKFPIEIKSSSWLVKEMRLDKNWQYLDILTNVDDLSKKTTGRYDYENPLIWERFMIGDISVFFYFNLFDTFILNKGIINQIFKWLPGKKWNQIHSPILPYVLFVEICNTLKKVLGWLPKDHKLFLDIDRIGNNFVSINKEWISFYSTNDVSSLEPMISSVYLLNQVWFDSSFDFMLNNISIENVDKSTNFYPPANTYFKYLLWDNLNKIYSGNILDLIYKKVKWLNIKSVDKIRILKKLVPPVFSPMKT